MFVADCGFGVTAANRENAVEAIRMRDDYNAIAFSLILFASLGTPFSLVLFSIPGIKAFIVTVDGDAS